MHVELIEDLQKIAQTVPLVHNITNYVVMNWTANCLLAIGASPIMAYAEEETPQLVRQSRALVINIGTLDAHWIGRMEQAMQTAQEQGVPVVVDPVGAGATQLRTETVQRWLEQGWVAVLRGNASEILSLGGERGIPKGVDSQHTTEQTVPVAERLSQRYGCVVCVSGAVDWVVALGKQPISIHHGHPLMTRVTGMGCAATALVGAFVAVQPDWMSATTHAMALMGMAGERAALEAPGPGTLAVSFLDALYQFSRTALGDTRQQ